jgi:hypothetical protein
MQEIGLEPTNVGDVSLDFFFPFYVSILARVDEVLG